MDMWRGGCGGLAVNGSEVRGAGVGVGLRMHGAVWEVRYKEVWYAKGRAVC